MDVQRFRCDRQRALKLKPWERVGDVDIRRGCQLRRKDARPRIELRCRRWE